MREKSRFQGKQTDLENPKGEMFFGEDEWTKRLSKNILWSRRPEECPSESVVQQK